MTGGPHLARFSRDVGFHGCLRATFLRQHVLRSMVIYTQYTQGPRFVESHPSFVAALASRATDVSMNGVVQIPLNGFE
jgi:hypothetical protein